MAIIPGNTGVAATFPDGFLLGAGSVGAPSYRLGDATTGFYSPGTNQWALSTAGVQTMLVSASGAFTFGAAGGVQSLALNGTKISIYNPDNTWAELSTNLGLTTLALRGSSNSINASYSITTVRANFTNSLTPFSISDAGAVTLGPVANIQHTINGGVTPVKLVPNSGTVVGLNLNDYSILEAGSGVAARFRVMDSTRTTNYGECGSAGAWTLGPTSSTATNAIINGAASVTHGVIFPSTSNLSAGANTLDDYEEGTFTPGIAFGGASVGVTYSALRYGNYQKIGNRVHFNLYFVTTSKGSSTGVVTITGLPFTAVGSASGGYSAPSIWSSGLSFTNYSVTGYVAVNTTNINIEGIPTNATAAGSAAAADTQVASATNLMISGSYITAS